MIWLTKLDGSPIILNDDQIIFVEVVHDTLISLTNGDALRVLEPVEEVVRRIARWRRSIQGFGLLEAESPLDGE